MGQQNLYFLVGSIVILVNGLQPTSVVMGMCHDVDI